MRVENTMEVTEQIKVFQHFLEMHYLADLMETVRKGENYFVVDFIALSKHSPELADLLLEQPEEVIKACELAVSNFDLPKDVKNFHIRFTNISEQHKIFTRNIRSEHINKLLVVEGTIRQKSDVRPQVTAARFECPSCGNVMNVLQLDTKFKEPSRCGCGRKGKFRLLSKELIDVQGIVLEEATKDLEGGAQPKRINILLKQDLVSPMSDKKTNPGTTIQVIGILKEIPIILRSGGQSTKFDLLLEANNIVPLEEDYSSININPETEEEIKKLAEDPKIYQKLANALAPGIYGHQKIKEALILQFVGGVKKVRDDGVMSRGDIHILLIGDPGCIAGDSQIALYHKGMKPIKTLGTYHLQPIRELVTKIRKGPMDFPYDYTSNFQIYKKQPTLRIVTETGKEIVCTYNQPFLTKIGWKRADLLSFGEEIRVMPKIPHKIKNYKKTGFTRVKATSGKLKYNINIPEIVTPELASLYGYILGDGNVHPKGYRITCYVNDEEKDLVLQLTNLWNNVFGVGVQVYISKPKEKTIIEKGKERKIFSLMPLHILEINSRQIAVTLSFLAQKRVPQLIFESPLDVISAFLRWLFEADGCTFSTGRGKTSVQLKSKSIGLLQDVQLLFLYYGIQSRIIEDNLVIRRSNDIDLFAKKIGFASKKKKDKLEKTIKDIIKKNKQQKRKTPQRFEKVRVIQKHVPMDVFDFEVPHTQCFIANGIVCHNSGKSQLLKRCAVVAPKARFVSGKGVSGAGITAAVVKDEFLSGWSLEAGAMVLANKGVLMIDELDKMNDDDRSAMHEGLEQQSISISKANIQATLRCETTVLAAANPKLGRFDPYEPIAKQIDLPPALINRFDLIFSIKDLPDKEKDEKLAKFILSLHKKQDTEEPEIPTDMLRKYLIYAKQKINPRLSDQAFEELKEYYVKMRSSGGDEKGMQSIPISARQLEALVRLSEACAKVRLGDSITRKDARYAINLLHYCLEQVGLDPETGKIDIDRISTGITTSERAKIVGVREIIHELEEKLGHKVIPIEEIIKVSMEKGLTEDKVLEFIEKLKRSGDLFEPRKGHISRI